MYVSYVIDLATVYSTASYGLHKTVIINNSWVTENLVKGFYFQSFYILSLPTWWMRGSIYKQNFWLRICFMNRLNENVHQFSIGTRNMMKCYAQKNQILPVVKIRQGKEWEKLFNRKLCEPLIFVANFYCSFNAIDSLKMCWDGH